MEKVINYVNTNRGNGRKESLDRLFKLLDRLGNPHKNLQVIHITGTNGKGSTSAFFAAALREANLTVGLFTSPHLEQVNERIRINDDMISDEDFIRVVKKMEPIILELEDEMKSSPFNIFKFRIMPYLQIYFVPYQNILPYCYLYP